MQSQKPTQNIDTMWPCQICDARIWLSNQRRHANTNKRKDANYVLSEGFEMV